MHVTTYEDSKMSASNSLITESFWFMTTVLILVAIIYSSSNDAVIRGGSRKCLMGGQAGLRKGGTY